MLQAAIAAHSERAGHRFIEFFTATIRNRKQFFDWCEDHRLGLDDIEPIAIAAYVEELGSKIARPIVKQHLAAILQLCDYLVTGGILLSTPAGSVRGPKYVVTRGKTPVLSGAEMRQLLKSIDTGELSGLRDRALLGLMDYTFARVSAVATLRVEDYFQQGRRSWVRLHEKGGKRHEVPCHHSLDEYLDAWIAAAGIADDKKVPITQEWLEDATALRAGATAMAAGKAEFRRIIRGLNTLLAGLKQTGQDRLHQFVRSLEALILPDVGKTKNQFIHRCQTFAAAGKDTRLVLQEAFDMRSDTEHLHEWDEAAQNYPANPREDVCWQRTRQIEQLAGDAYSRLLRDAALRQHFRTDAATAAFWRLRDDERCSVWGKPLDITQEPFVQKIGSMGKSKSMTGRIWTNALSA